ncbi:MAG: response regulator transcription factor [Pseudomonadota bacterium]|jgi:DNA-binding NarL/FixJ family response regulator
MSNEAGVQDQKGARILCIEDNVEIASLLKEELGDLGYEVVLAHDGREGLAEIFKTTPDLVICDINMPNLNGFEVLERLVALSPRFQDLPFLFLTAQVDRDTELKARRAGAADFLTKPVDFEVLDAIIGSRLARAPRLADKAADVGLSNREIEVLSWVAQGKTSEEIAMIMSLTKRTVDFHTDNARAKLGVATRIQAVVKAISHKIIEP